VPVHCALVYVSICPKKLAGVSMGAQVDLTDVVPID